MVNVETHKQAQTSLNIVGKNEILYPIIYYIAN